MPGCPSGKVSHFVFSRSLPNQGWFLGEDVNLPHLCSPVVRSSLHFWLVEASSRRRPTQDLLSAEQCTLGSCSLVCKRLEAVKTRPEQVRILPSCRARLSELFACLPKKQASQELLCGFYDLADKLQGICGFKLRNRCDQNAC